MRKMRKISLLILAGLLIICQPGSAQGGENMVKDGKFQIDADEDGMSDRWQFSGDAGVTAIWTLDEGFMGQFSQKISCTSFTSLSSASHVMLCQIDTVDLEKGQWYKISFAAKQEGIRGRAVHVAISNMETWTNCGLRESFRVHSQWKQFEFVFRATQTISQKVRLQFWYNSTGTFWLDHVRLEQSEAIARKFTEILPPTDAINLIPNSSFQCGATGWGSIADLPGWGGNLNTLVGTVDRSTFRIALTKETIPVYYFDYFPLYREPVTAPLLANRGWITVEPGANYTLSAYMKAESESAGILSVQQAFRGNLRKDIHLTDEWERYTFTFQPQVEQIFVALGLDLKASEHEAGTVWIDNVQLEKGVAATSYGPRAKLEIGIEISEQGNIFPYGAEPEMTAVFSNADTVLHSVDLQLKITDFDDSVVYEDTIEIDVPPGQTTRAPIRPSVRQKGFYRLHLRSETGEIALTRSIRFAIVEPYTQPDSLFGMNHAYPWPHLLDLSKQIGLRWFRDWSLKWHDVEREEGKFDFTEADHQINRVLESGLNVLPLLPFPSSNWSSSSEETEEREDYPASRERIAYMPRDLETFANYVRATIEHYKDRLHVWEILNEPIYTGYALPGKNNYDVTDYVQLLQVAYQTIKATDPDALVIGGIAGGTQTYTREFMEAGGLSWVDVLNLHSYPGLAAPESYEDGLSQLREQMRSAGEDKPIWFTEGAYYADDDMPVEPHDSSWLTPADSEVEAAEWQVKFNTILLAYGVEKIIYHSGTPGSLNNESLSGIFFEWAGAPRKMLVTQSAMSNLLPASTKPLGRLDTPENVMAYGFETGGQTVIVAWAEEYTETEISLDGKPWRAVDIQGNELESVSIMLTERPVYFIRSGVELKQLPW